MRGRSFIPLFVTNLFGTMNDNFLKTLASFIVIGWIQDASLRPVFMGVTAGSLVLPFILCSPLADRLTAVFPKRRILQLAKGAEIPIVGIGIAGFAFHSAALVVAAILLMGLQSSLYSPAKYALIRDIGGEERISTGMGGMEGVSFLGVLAGTIMASFAVDHCAPWVQWTGLVAFAVLGLGFSLTVRAEEEKNRAIHAINPIRYVRRAYRIAKGYPGLNAVILTLSVFWWAAAMLQMGLLVYGKEVMGLDSTRTGVMLCAAAVGIVVGQVLAGFADRRHFLLGTTLFTGWLAAVLLAVLFFVPMGPTAFGTVLAVLAFDLGFFKLPFDAEIQKVVKGPKLNTMLAYFNQVSFFFMLLASGCYAFLSWLCGPKAFLLLLAVVFAVVPVLFALNYRSVLTFVGRWILARRYKVEVTGVLGKDMRRERQGESSATNAIKQSNNQTIKQSYLVLPNHPAMVDPMLVMAEFGEQCLRPLVDEAFFHAGIVAPMVLRTVGAVEVPDLRKHRSAKGATAARGLHEMVLKSLRDGGSVIFYPAGHIQTEADRDDIGTRQLAYNVCKCLPEGVEVIGIRTRGLWGSIWSRKGRTATPNFVLTLLKGVLLWFLVSPFVPRRKVTMLVENLTARTREWSKLSRLEFNRELEKWYNAEREVGSGAR